MDHNYSTEQQQRHATMSVFFVVFVVGFSLLFLIAVSGGLFLYVLLLAGFIFFVAAIHYVLWGKLFSEQTAGESEEERLRQRAAEIESGDDWHMPDTRIRR